MLLRLIKAKKKDLELVMAWRSNEAIYRYFLSQNAPLTWEEHLSFWANRKNRIDWIIWFKDGGTSRRVGVINVSNLHDPLPQIGVVIGEVSLWGKGIGALAVRRVLGYLKKKKYKGAMAIIRDDNCRSLRLFQKCGFEKEETRDRTMYVHRF